MRSPRAWLASYRERVQFETDHQIELEWITDPEEAKRRYELAQMGGWRYAYDIMSRRMFWAGVARDPVVRFVVLPMALASVVMLWLGVIHW